MKRLQVKVNDLELRKLKRRMKQAFPYERIELLVGRRGAGVVCVDEFWQIPHRAGKDHCEYSHEMLLEIKKRIKRDGLELLGTIHSHPNTFDGSLSEIDLHYAHVTKEIVSGICSIYKTSGGQKRCRILFWQPFTPLNAVLF